ncbi:hypothetical protein VPK24_17505 [Limnothrix redekei LRLZ20PSL1]|uniref:Uncharacterized protein n=1 Tax=Limnothrix redekei LRLZ20PSL1 TaxID=3112953 RepID=A0ABW7CE97_9CYAN
MPAKPPCPELIFTDFGGSWWIFAANLENPVFAITLSPRKTLWQGFCGKFEPPDSFSVVLQFSDSLLVGRALQSPEVG